MVIRDGRVEDLLIAQSPACAKSKFLSLERGDAWVAYLKSHGIIAGVYYPVPVHLMSA